MESTEDELFQKFANLCGHCRRVTLLPYEREIICFSCRYNVIKRNNKLSEISRKKYFINRLKYAEHKNLFRF